MPKTLYDKIWDAHVVHETAGEPAIMYIDLHLIHEVTSPQAFAGLNMRGMRVRRPDLTFATMDHAVPSHGRFEKVWKDQNAQKQIATLEENCNKYGITLFGLESDKQGIVHVIGPELGLTSPGMTIVCGDSHTSTHGAFGALAFGIGTSEVEQVFATQCLLQKKSKTMAITVTGALPHGVYAKDLILAIIQRIGVGGGVGSTIEYRGSAIEKLSMEERLTVCNMSIEAGARAGMIAPDEKTVEYLMDRVTLGLPVEETRVPDTSVSGRSASPLLSRSAGTMPAAAAEGFLTNNPRLRESQSDEIAPNYLPLRKGEIKKGYLLRDAPEIKEKIVKKWLSLRSDTDAVFDREVTIDASEIEPMLTWGTNPGMSVKISERIPNTTENPEVKKALEYMGMQPGQPIDGQHIDYVFIGSCTNARIEDLRVAAQFMKRRRVAPGRVVYVVPGSQQVKAQAEKEGLKEIFEQAGAEWRDPGCSMCIAMNGDAVPEGAYCASTSNRNFMGRQGKGARTLLMSPAMAAVAAIEGRVCDVRKYF
ncbi:MAG: 3-isopropylmalate dehydratase large subunit [Patescibacteria group bacterium]